MAIDPTGIPWSAFSWSVFESVIAVAAIAALCGLAIVLSKAWHGRLSMDGTMGIQKVHTAPTPRIGGLAIYLASLSSLALVPSDMRDIIWPILVSGTPAFLAGFAEDITKNVSPGRRLLMTIISGAIYATGFGYAFDLADMQWVDWLGQADWAIWIFATCLVTIGMAGVANAVNITDGFHGLAPGSLVIMNLACAALALSVGDVALAGAALVFAAAAAGFLVINWPFGKLFLGDAGAYFAGFALAAIAVLVTARNREISPFVSMLVIFYPVYETLFSIHRKRRRSGHSPSRPDAVHLHSLMSRSIARPIAGALGRAGWKNALSGMLIWPLPAICALLAIAADGSGRAAILGCVVFALLYGRIYQIVSLQRVPLLNRLENALRRRPGTRE